MASSELLKRVRATFEREPRVNLHQYPIDVAVDGDTLILEGEVESIAAKKIALELGAAMPEIAGVVDRLRIARTTTMTDEEMRDHLRDSLVQEPAFRDVSLQVEAGGHREVARRARGEPYAFIHSAVEDGVVTMNGQLPSLSHKRLAGVLAWWIPGTRDVINGIEVLPPQEDNDDEITDAVRLVLEKDRLVEASEISVHTVNRIVTLRGFAPNDDIGGMAERDAWFVFGVDGVRNELSVGSGG
jgi:osmotically-inducible protein OsmY